MHHDSQLIRQAQHYKAVKARLFAGMKKTIEPAQRDYDAHILAWRQWCDMKASIRALSTSITVSGSFGTCANAAQYSVALDEDVEFVVTRRSMKDICLDVLKAHPKVSFDDIRGPRRCRFIVAARQECMYSIYTERRDVSFPMIGRFFGGRDHTTVLHAVHKIRAQREGKAA